MANEDTNNAQTHQQSPDPNPDLNNLERLVGTWEMSGGVRGTVTYEWMEGGFFLIQRVDLEHFGQRIKGLEIIGHERPFGADPSEEIKSRFYSNTGDTLDYVYEFQADTLTIWGAREGLRRITGAPLATTATPSAAPGTTLGVAATRRPPARSADRRPDRGQPG